MKKRLLLSVFVFITIFFQIELQGQKPYGLEFNFFQFRYHKANQISGPILKSKSERDILSINPEVLFFWEKNKKWRFQGGVGLSPWWYSLATGRIYLEDFSNRANLGWQVHGNEQNYFVRKVKFKNEYLRIPLGVRFYPMPHQKWARINLSARLEGSILMKTTSEFIIGTLDTFEITHFYSSEYTRTVSVPKYNKAGSEFFDAQANKFLLNLRLGLGIDWAVKDWGSLGHEISYVQFLNSPNPSFLENPTGLGITFTVKFFFD